MEKCGDREYALLEKIGFVRTAGSPEELKAAGILMDEVRSLGVEPELEPFPISSYEMKKLKFEVLEPEYKEYEVTGWGFSGSTDPEGLTADFAYVQEATPMDLRNVKGKIVLVNAGMNLETYKRLLKAGVAGFITWSGSVIDDNSRVDMDLKVLRELYLAEGKIPGVNLRARDAMKMVESEPARVRITMIQEESTLTSHNIIACLPGTEFPDEEICFVAHYDSTPYSPGVYDNGAGDVIIMEVLRHFVANPPRRSLRFVWMGSEERGLYGSKYYVEAHKDELEKIQLLVNVDMAGPILGRDRSIVTADISLMHMVEYLSAELGFPVETKHDVYSSDSTPFAGKGVPAISFARFGSAGTAPGHNRYDIMEHLSAKRLEGTTNFLLTFADRIVGSYMVPVPREMPDNILEALDLYLNKGIKAVDRQKK